MTLQKRGRGRPNRSQQLPVELDRVPVSILPYPSADESVEKNEAKKVEKVKKRCTKVTSKKDSPNQKTESVPLNRERQNADEQRRKLKLNKLIEKLAEMLCIAGKKTKSTILEEAVQFIDKHHLSPKQLAVAKVLEEKIRNLEEIIVKLIDLLSQNSIALPNSIQVIETPLGKNLKVHIINNTEPSSREPVLQNSPPVVLQPTQIIHPIGAVASNALIGPQYLPYAIRLTTSNLPCIKRLHNPPQLTTSQNLSRSTSTTTLNKLSCVTNEKTLSCVATSKNLPCIAISQSLTCVTSHSLPSVTSSSDNLLQVGTSHNLNMASNTGNQISFQTIPASPTVCSVSILTSSQAKSIQNISTQKSSHNSQISKSTADASLNKKSHENVLMTNLAVRVGQEIPLPQISTVNTTDVKRNETISFIENDTLTSDGKILKCNKQPAKVSQSTHKQQKPSTEAADTITLQQVTPAILQKGLNPTTNNLSRKDIIQKAVTENIVVQTTYAISQQKFPTTTTSLCSTKTKTNVVFSSQQNATSVGNAKNATLRNSPHKIVENSQNAEVEISKNVTGKRLHTLTTGNTTLWRPIFDSKSTKELKNSAKSKRAKLSIGIPPGKKFSRLNVTSPVQDFGIESILISSKAKRGKIAKQKQGHTVAELLESNMDGKNAHPINFSVKKIESTKRVETALQSSSQQQVQQQTTPSSKANTQTCLLSPNTQLCPVNASVASNVARSTGSNIACSVATSSAIASSVATSTNSTAVKRWGSVISNASSKDILITTFTLAKKRAKRGDAKGSAFVKKVLVSKRKDRQTRKNAQGKLKALKSTKAHTEKKKPNKNLKVKGSPAAENKVAAKLDFIKNEDVNKQDIRYSKPTCTNTDIKKTADQKKVVRTMADRTIPNKWLEKPRVEIPLHESITTDQCASPVISFPNFSRKRTTSNSAKTIAAKRVKQKQQRSFSAESLSKSATAIKNKEPNNNKNVGQQQQPATKSTKKLAHHQVAPMGNNPLPTILNIFAPAPPPSQHHQQQQQQQNEQQQTCYENNNNTEQLTNEILNEGVPFQPNMLNQQMLNNFATGTTEQPSLPYAIENLIGDNTSHMWNSPWLAQDIPDNLLMLPPSNATNNMPIAENMPPPANMPAHQNVQTQQNMPSAGNMSTNENMSAGGNSVTECSPIKSIISIIQTDNNQSMQHFNNMHNNMMFNMPNNLMQQQRNFFVNPRMPADIKKQHHASEYNNKNNKTYHQMQQFSAMQHNNFQPFPNLQRNWQQPDMMTNNLWSMFHDFQPNKQLYMPK